MIMIFVEIKRNLIIAQSSLSCQATGRGWLSTFTLSSALSSGISELGKGGRSIPRSRTLPLTLMATEGATVKAVALIAGDPNVKGSLHFFQDATGATHVTGRIAGLSPGLHGFHIHALGDTTNGCISTGPHFNPLKRNHGARTHEDRHAGDLGNIFAGQDGVAEIRLKDMQIPLTGPHSILGRAVVVHADPDDLGRGGHELSKTTGNSGARVGCGVIGLQSAV